MQLYHLKYILKVAELGSITKAANELYISQPSLTKAILNLEKEYNIKLFERSPTGVTVTQEGKDFLHYAKNVVYSASALDKVFKNSSYTNQTQLFVAAQQLDFIPQVFTSLHNTYSNTPLEFELYTSHRSNVVRAIQKGHCNIGLLVETNRDAKAFNWQINSTNLEIEVLDSSNVYLLLGPKSNLYNANCVSFKDVANLPHICLDIDDMTRSEWKTSPKSLHVNANHTIYCNSIPLCIELLEQTDMVLYGTKWILKYFQNTNIRILPIASDTSHNCTLIGIKRKHEPLTPIEMQFIEEVKMNLNV